MVPQYLKLDPIARMNAARDAHRANGTSGGKSWRMRDASQYAPVDPDSWQVFLWRVLSRARDDRERLIATMRHEIEKVVAGTFADQGDGAFLHVVEHNRPRRPQDDCPF